MGLVTNLLEVLALELSDELVEALGVGINTDGGEDALDVGGGGRLVAGQGQEEVSGEVLHFDRLSQKIRCQPQIKYWNEFVSTNAPTHLRLMQTGSETQTFVLSSRTGETIDLTANWAETATSSSEGG